MYLLFFSFHSELPEKQDSVRLEEINSDDEEVGEGNLERSVQDHNSPHLDGNQQCDDESNEGAEQGEHDRLFHLFLLILMNKHFSFHLNFLFRFSFTQFQHNFSSHFVVLFSFQVSMYFLSSLHMAFEYT